MISIASGGGPIHVSPGFGDGPGEVGVLGEEAVSRVQPVRPGPGRHVEDLARYRGSSPRPSGRRGRRPRRPARTCRASRSRSEYTATLATPSSRHVRMTRTAISPRLAIRTLLSTSRHSDSVLIAERVRAPPGARHPLHRHRAARRHRLHQPGGRRAGRRRRAGGPGGGGGPPDRRAGPPGPVVGGRTGRPRSWCRSSCARATCRSSAGTWSPPPPDWPPGRPVRRGGRVQPGSEVAQRPARRGPQAGGHPGRDGRRGGRDRDGVQRPRRLRRGRPGSTRRPAGGSTGRTSWAPGWPRSTATSAGWEPIGGGNRVRGHLLDRRPTGRGGCALDRRPLVGAGRGHRRRRAAGRAPRRRHAGGRGGG